jgi:hypothetical protein
MKLKFYFLILSTLWAHSVLAQDKQQETSPVFYGEIAHLPLIVKFPDTSKIRPKLARITIGMDINENWALEGMAGTTVNKDEEVTATMGGVFLKPHTPVAEDVELFGRIGFNRALLGGSAGGAVSNVAYGFGMQMQLTKDYYGQIDYMMYGRGPNSESTRGLSLALGVRF